MGEYCVQERPAELLDSNRMTAVPLLHALTLFALLMNIFLFAVNLFIRHTKHYFSSYHHFFSPFSQNQSVMPPVSSGDLFFSIPDLLHDAVQSSDVAPATPASSRPRRACAPTSLGQMLRVAYDRLIPPKVFGVDTKKRKHVRDSDDDTVVPSVKRKSSSVVRHPAPSNESSPALGRSLPLMRVRLLSDDQHNIF